MIPKVAVVSTAPSIPASNLKNEILWAAEEGYGNMPTGDLNRFPDITAIQVRNSSSNVNHLETFYIAISNAKTRVLIIDSYLFNPDKGKESKQKRIETVMRWFSGNSLDVNHIKILTKCHNKSDDLKNEDIKKQFDELVEMINLGRTQTNKCQIEINFSLLTHFDYIHDRFAVIDEELWHFGATVGGLHAQVSAVTRGWDAVKHGAIDFFELAWKGNTIMGKQTNDY